MNLEGGKGGDPLWTTESMLVEMEEDRGKEEDADASPATKKMKKVPEIEEREEGAEMDEGKEMEKGEEIGEREQMECSKEEWGEGLKKREDNVALMRDIDRWLLDEEMSQKYLVECIRRRAIFHSRNMPRRQVMFSNSYGGFGFCKTFTRFWEAGDIKKCEIEFLRTLEKEDVEKGNWRGVMQRFALSVFQMQNAGIAALERVLIAYHVLRLNQVAKLFATFKREQLERDEAALKLGMLQRHIIGLDSLRETTSTRGTEGNEEGTAVYDVPDDDLSCWFWYSRLTEKKLQKCTSKQLRSMEAFLTEKLRQADAKKLESILHTYLAEQVSMLLPFAPSAEEIEALASAVLEEYAALRPELREEEASYRTSFLEYLLDAGKIDWSKQHFLSRDGRHLAEHISENCGKHAILKRCLDNVSLQHLAAKKAFDPYSDEDQHDTLVDIGLMLASGRHCKLKIAYVPALVDYQIAEYDGLEQVVY